MPRLKEKEVPFVKMQRLIKGYGYNGESLASILGVCKTTARKKLDNPERFTLADIARINRYGHIPMDEIREAVVK